MSRPYVGSYQRHFSPYKKAHYVRLDTAIPRAINHLLLHGMPGDVFELAHSEFGFQVATVKVHVGGKITIRWRIAE